MEELFKIVFDFIEGNESNLLVAVLYNNSNSIEFLEFNVLNKEELTERLKKTYKEYSMEDYSLYLFNEGEFIYRNDEEDLITIKIKLGRKNESPQFYLFSSIGNVNR